MARFCTSLLSLVFFFLSFSSVYVEILAFVLLEMGDFRKRQTQRYSFLGLCL